MTEDSIVQSVPLAFRLGETTFIKVYNTVVVRSFRPFAETEEINLRTPPLG